MERLRKERSMGIFDLMSQGSHEEVVFCENKAAGLRCIIAIHDTTLGPALGGCRMYPYKSEEEALIDVLRLSKGMTYKAAAAGLNLGGGKAVIIGDPKKDKTEMLFRAYGRFIESLNGRYITAEDAGTSVQDMEYVFMETKYVTGVAPAHGGSGDPSPVTAFGLFHGLIASVEKAYDRRFTEEEMLNLVHMAEAAADPNEYAERYRNLKGPSLEGLSVAVQGLGSVGSHLVGHLVDAGARVIATDIDQDACEKVKTKYHCEIVAPEEIYGVDCDIFSPCAMGAIVNDKTIDQLKCKVVCGASNNQLAEDRHGQILEEKGIVYAPDYVVNAGGLINVYVEMEGYIRKRALRMASQIYGNTKRVFEIADKQKIPTYIAADRLAEERVEGIGQIKKGFFGGI
jgi:leucine dehydrogenase